MTKCPEHRYLYVSDLAKKKKPLVDTQEYELDLYKLLTKQKCSDTIDRAYNIFKHEYKRETLEATLLSGFSNSDVNKILQVPIAVVSAYSYLFFDTSVFLDELDRTDYAYTYAKSIFGKELKQSAVNLGKECLKIRLSKGSYTVSPRVVQDCIRSTAFMMANLVQVNQADSSLANSALKWAQVALKAVENDQGATTDNALEQLKMTLITHEDSVDEKTSNIPVSSIIH